MLPVPGRLRTARGLRALLIVTMVAIIILHGFPSVLKVQIWRGMRLSDALELAVPLIVCALLFTLMHAQVTGVRQTLGAMADMLRGRRSRQNSDKPWRDGGANQEELRPMPANLDLPPSAQADPAAGGGGLLSSDSSVLVPEPRALAAGYSVTMLELLCFVIPAAIYATGHGAHTFANRIKGLLKTEVPETSNVFIVADFLDEKLSHYVSMAGLYLMLLALVWRHSTSLPTFPITNATAGRILAHRIGLVLASLFFGVFVGLAGLQGHVAPVAIALFAIQTIGSLYVFRKTLSRDLIVEHARPVCAAIVYAYPAAIVTMVAFAIKNGGFSGDNIL